MVRITRTTLDNEHDIAAWLDDREIRNYTIDHELGVRVLGHVDLSSLALEDLGLNLLAYFPVQFTEIDGNFTCTNQYLVSLLGAPYVVHGDCSFGNNRLASLEGVPQVVSGKLDLSYNFLSSLEGIPPEIKGSLNVSNNNLSSLEFAPKHVGGDFDFSYNPVGSFEHLPQVGGDVDCIETNIRSLSTLPHSLATNTEFYCSGVIEVVEFFKRPLTDLSYTRISSEPVNEIYRALKDKKLLEKEVPQLDNAQPQARILKI